MAFLALVFFLGAPARGASWRVVLDPGHDPKDRGALGAGGRHEVEYNDELTARLADRLSRDSRFEVVVTRNPSESLSLRARVARIQAAAPTVVLSLHHDSAQERYLRPCSFEGRPARCATRPLRGHSLFVSRRGARPKESLRLARAIGRAVRELRGAPTEHHAENIPGEGREWADRALGIHWYDELAVLKGSPAPAVLLEAGVLVDERDEREIASPAFRAKLVESLHSALVQFLSK